MTTETWRAVVLYEGLYEVSNLGNMRSLPRTLVTSHGVARRYPGGPVAGWVGNTGYISVSLSREGDKRKTSLHTIVATAFCGPRPTPFHVVCHYDGDKLNNVVTNLRWDTQSNNLRDAVRHGTHHWAAKDYGDYSDMGCRILAAVYADHPDYREEWA